MGLDTTHNAWNGSYSSFNRWREKLAEKVNIRLRSMDGFGGSVIWDQSANYYPLLSHSDCDGELTVDECKKTVDFLKSIIDEFQPDPDYGAKEEINQFINGCKEAIKLNQSIKFQ
jgi:malate/lactate dehydrogenase